MADPVPFYLQPYVENDRNEKFQWLTYGVVLIAFGLHGIIFHWIPIYLRKQRSESSNITPRYFTFLRGWELLNVSHKFTIPLLGSFYIQPSMFLLFAAYLAIMGVFSMSQVSDITYLPRLYVVAKRISKVSLSNLPLIYVMIIKNDLVTSLTGIKHDKLLFFHKWFSRTMFTMISIHVVLASRYWLHLGFPVMLVIPPQIFGFIAFGSFFLLNFASFKFIRRWAYDFFLVQHRVFSFIMLLFVLFHNSTNTTGAVVLSVHQLVIDNILCRIIAFVHTRQSPTKGKSTFEILDEDTVLVTVKLNAFPYSEMKWWRRFLPKWNTWKAGQHVYLTVPKVKWFQKHPFTIASISESGEMKFVIRVQKGFTKKLRNKILSKGAPAVDHEKNEENEDDDVVLKATFAGPFGAQYQPLITFDSVLFFGAGSGAAFSFPVCLDLLNTIQRRNSVHDYFGRNPSPLIKLVWAIKKSANVCWFRFVLDELAQYCQEGLLSIDVYVTQEKDRELYDISEGISVSQTGSSVTIYDVPNVKFHYSRPNIDGVIKHHVDHLKDGTNFRSMAVVSCGPLAFNHTIEKECQKQRWDMEAPDIYCYTESFG
ncbi:ferric reductase [Yamadazyma tenuis ATCC 10573]|uniref:ferric-chelate reductase (NADPH) n=1 Tax=Candida tenuis (strain ATCC 10573 / BCRC 21748 / CBS 615 / JCM 9827 / NBRC 10315 / NRRL Y-1498 / VKM Y-70) TaxID=590646 RepID=G3B1I2_CANTC|nr:ferric reductase [Yamadazyma tenuis ATCC 10573]EGV64976.1 ferric reductase [Yamadazyma tenuis ATCC 10573]